MRPSCLFAIGVCLAALGFMALVYSRSLREKNRLYIRIDLVAIGDALDRYSKAHDGVAPPTLATLLELGADGEPYLHCTHVPRDPWNREYVYIRGDPPNVTSYGRDGVPGGEGKDADIDLRAIAGGR